MTAVFPTLKYDDAHAAIEFLERVLGFERHAVHDAGDGQVAHAELKEPTDQAYGSRDFSLADPEGNVWAFGTYAPG